MNASARMQPRLDFITLSVSDLEAAVAFYRDGLGLPTGGIVGDAYLDETTGVQGTIAFFELQGGLMLGLYERVNLAKDPPSRTKPAAPWSSASAISSLAGRRSTACSNARRRPALA